MYYILKIPVLVNKSSIEVFVFYSMYTKNFFIYTVILENRNLKIITNNNKINISVL